MKPPCTGRCPAEGNSEHVFPTTKSCLFAGSFSKSRKLVATNQTGLLLLLRAAALFDSPSPESSCSPFRLTFLGVQDPRAKQQQRVAAPSIRFVPCSTRVLLAAAPTTPPCVGRRPRSSSLHWADCLPCCAGPPCSTPIAGTIKSNSPHRSAVRGVAFLVEAMGVEPMSEKSSAQVSPGAGDLQHSLRVTPVVRLTLQ